jgi:ankyrin repeat protein
MKAGAALGYLYPKKQSLLHLAASAGKQGIVTKLFLTCMAPAVNVADADGRTALHIACAHGDTDSATALLDADADVNLCDDDGVSPLSLACRINNTDLVRILCDRGAKIDCSTTYGEWIIYNPILAAVMHNNCDILQILLDAKADVNSRGPEDLTPLLVACKNGYVDIARILVDHGASRRFRDASFNSAADYARDSENAEALLEVLEGGPK